MIIKLLKNLAEVAGTIIIYTLVVIAAVTVVYLLAASCRWLIAAQF